MNFPTYYSKLDRQQRLAYAKRAGTTVGYIQNHLIRARKIPRKTLIQGLAEASDGALTEASLLAHFYQTPERQANDQPLDGQAA